MRTRIVAPTLCLLAGALLAGGAPVQAGSFKVAKGWDLFQTDKAGTRFHPISGLPLLANCQGMPIGSYDFPGVGARATGPYDTIVERRSAAVPLNPIVPIELVALQLQCDLNLGGNYLPTPAFVTLQSDRGRNITDPPAGPPSVGQMDIQFDGSGDGGTASSRLTVKYDVRLLSLDGPIINLPGGPVPDTANFQTNGVPWRHEKPVGDSTCLAELDILVSDQHQVISQDYYIAAVNYLLNGIDPGEDFNYGFLEAVCKERA